MARGTAEMPFLDHLEELRWRLVWSLVALIVACVLGFIAVTQLDVLGLIERPIRDLLPPDQQLIYTSPTTPLFITFKLAFVLGLVLALPFLGFQLWGFLSPALYDHERRFVVPSIAVASVLFLAGVAMAYFLVLPLGLKILLGFHSESLQPFITIDAHLRFAVGIILAFGAIFELPVILVFLSVMGIVTPEGLAKYRRHAIVVLAILSAFLTPADPYTMMMMLVPMMLLYESSILVIRAIAGRRERSTELARTEGSAG